MVPKIDIALMLRPLEVNIADYEPELKARIGITMGRDNLHLIVREN